MFASLCRRAVAGRGVLLASGGAAVVAGATGYASWGASPAECATSVVGGKAMHGAAFPKTGVDGVSRAWDYNSNADNHMKMDKVVVFTGNSNPSLALEICQHLGVNLSQGTVAKFADGETKIQVTDDARGKVRA